MARFERSRERKGRSSRRDNRGRRDSGRRFNRGRDRREVEMTKVICSECGKECEVPFKPTTDKPLFCDECFKTKGRKGSGSKDLEKINEKLDKIMKALKIE